MNAARIRVRRYKPKGSDLWVVCIHESAMNSVRAEVLTRCRETILMHGDNEIAGFALVVWDKDQNWSTDFANIDGRIPLALIPDYARNCLLANTIEDWTLQSVRKMMGWLPPTSS